MGHHITRRACFAVPLLALTTPALAQDFPSRPVRIVVPFPAGGAADLAARWIAQKLATTWSQTVVVDNRPGGANGNLGAGQVAHAAPDGHTLLLSSSGAFTTNALLYRDTPFDPLHDLAPTSIVMVAPNLLVARAEAPYHTLPELIAYARANPGAVRYASQGVGSTGHLTGAYLALVSGADLVHVPYRGSVPAVADLLAGNIDIMWDTITSVLPHVREARLQGLATGGAERTPALPGLPTAAEQGLADFVSVGWFAVAAPGGTPLPIIERLSAAIRDAVQSPEIVRQMTELGALPGGGTPEAMAGYMRSETARWKRIIDQANISVN